MIDMGVIILISIGKSNNIRNLISNPSWLKSSDWLFFLGPIGVWLLERATPPPDYKMLFQRFITWCHGLQSPTFTHTQLRQLQIDGPLILTEMECMLPLYSMTINQHILLHVVERIVLCGPIYTHSMYLLPVSNSLHSRF
jgi:hypothetical protein